MNDTTTVSFRRPASERTVHVSTSRWFLIGLFGVVAVALAAGGYWFYRYEAQAIRTEKYDDLKTIAGLKINQIVRWRQERIGDAHVALSEPFLQSAVGQWATTSDNTSLRTEILARLDAIRTSYGYNNVILAGMDGGILLSLNPRLNELDSHAKQLVTQAASSREVVFGDFFRCPNCDQVHLDVVVAIPGADSRPAVALILRVDPEEYLYPLIQSWPTPSRSAETLLVRKDGDDVLFLNSLRHRPDPALTLRTPLSRSDLPGAQAVLGKIGEFEGRDYRGVAVLADLRPVPGSPWFMVTKVDADELLAEARYRGGVILLFVVLAILVTGLMAAFVFDYRQRNLYRSLFRAERERREAQEEIRATLYGIGDGVLATDAAGRVTRMNPVAERLTGWSEAEAVGQPLEHVFRILNEDTRSEVENPVERVLREGVVVGLANHSLLIARDGTERPIADSGAPIRNEKGDVIGVALVFRDQTEERQHQAALRESEALNRSLVEHLPQRIFIKDHNSVYLSCNANYAQDLGLVPEQIVGKDDFAFYPPELAEKYRADDQAVMAADTLKDIEERYQVAGEERWVHTFKVPYHDEQGRVIGVLGIFEDITARKRAEEALAQSERTSRVIFEGVRDGILAADTETKQFVIANEAICRMLGYDRSELLRLGVKDIHPEENFRYVAEQIERQIRCEILVATDIPVMRRDGSVFLADINSTPVEIDGRPCVIGVFRDLTARKLAEKEREKLEAQLRQAQKMEAVGRLAGGVAHDFNNMLGVILGYAEAALSELKPVDPIYKDIEEIRSAANRSADLIRQLLAFSRQQTIAPRVIDLNGQMKGMERLLRRIISEDIDIEFVLSPGLWPVNMDPSQVDQIVANLAVNARDAMPDGGRLTIETGNAVLDEAYCQEHAGFLPGNYVMLAVSDSGYGMDKETLERVFEPFFTTKGEGKGTGLGLATVYGAVKQNQGFINAYSEPNHGTTFRIYLPRYTGEGKVAGAAVQETSAAGGHETVLLVEDDAMLRPLAKRLLERLGYTVLEASGPGEAITLCEKHSGDIHLLLTDVVMPVMNGRELKDRVCALKPGIKVLYMSGYTANAIARRGVLEEGTNFIEKPFNPNDLGKKVRQVLDSAE
jgi:PAS domain S-box-containing protein